MFCAKLDKKKKDRYNGREPKRRGSRIASTTKKGEIGILKYYLAIDIGASSGRHILAHLEDGRIVTEEIYRFQNGPQTCTNGAQKHLMWDIERLYAEILNGLRRAGELGRIPVSVAIDTWGVDYVLLDAEDRPIGGAYCYRDARTEQVIDRVHELLPFERLYEKTGIQFASFNTIYQLADDVRTGRICEARAFMMLPDYFHHRLTGGHPQEYTNATTTGMVNAQTHTWDEEILDTLGLPRTLFHELSQPGTRVGAFTDAVAEAVGYRADVVLASSHDTASAVIAAPLDGRSPYISSGTWSLLGIEQDLAHTEPAARVADYSNEGTYGCRFRLQKNIMGLWMIQQVRHELGDAYDFAALERMARENPIPEAVNVNDRAFLAPESMIDAICGAVGRSLTVGEMAHCIFVSLAKSYAESLDALEKITGEHYETLNIIGGGSKNGFLNELTARYTGRRIITGPTEGTAIGNIVMQMIGDGALGSVEEGRRAVRRSFDIQTVNA